MTKASIGAALALLIASSTALAANAPSLEQRRQDLTGLLDEYWQYTLRENPEFATILGDKRYNDRLGDNSLAAVDAHIADVRRFRERLVAIDATGFPEQEALNQSLLLRRFDRELAQVRFRDWLMPVNQFYGLHIDLPQFVSQIPFETVKDYDDYVARLHQVPRVLDNAVASMRQGLAEKRVPPRILLEKVASQAAAVGAGRPIDSPFAMPLKRFGEAVPPAEQARLRAAVLGAIERDVNPAYARFTEFVKHEYAPRGRTDVGAWALPDGDAYYAALAEDNTTTTMSPQQIHELGLSEVARIEGEMLALAQKMGFKDLKSFVAATDANPALHPKSRQEILDLYQKYTDQMWAKAPQLFGRLPKAKVQILPVEEFREKEAAGAEYNQGTPDGSRPGQVRVNTRDPASQKTLEIETTAYHEGVPGHHLQISIAQELPELPPVRQQMFFNAYVEGWALYSERLGREVGFYQDPYSLFGHLQDDMLRAIRLVVDTGLHYKHWTREQVVDYFRAHGGGMDEGNVQSETDRYIAIPGQALGYKIGQLTLLRLRDKAEKALGKRFDIRAFHDTVLGAGALPMDVLERRIDAWISGQRA